MVTLYRSASYLRRRCNWTKAIVAKSGWVFLELEDRLHFLCLSKMIVSFIVAMLLAPWTAVLYLSLKVNRIALATLIKYVFRNYTVIDSQSVRCALDSRRNPGIVTLLLTLSEAIDLDELRRCIFRDVVEQKTDCGRLAFPNLRKRVKYRLGCYLSQQDEQFNIDNHVFAAESQWRGRSITEANIQSYIGEINSRPLPDTVSPWQVVLVNTQNTDVRSDVAFIVVRIHPVISEGLSLDRAIGATLQRQSPLSIKSISGFGHKKPSQSTTIKMADLQSPSQVQSVTAQNPEVENYEIPFHDRSYTMFCHSSATRELLQQMLVEARVLWQALQQKCDPSYNPPQSLATWWRSIRSVIAAFRKVRHEFSKSCDATVALGTVPDRTTMSRGAIWWWYHRAMLFIYFLPVFLYELNLTSPVTISISATIRRSLLAGLCLPWWCAQFGWSSWKLVSSMLVEIQLFVSSGRPVYVLVKRSMREIGHTASTAFAAPSLVFSEFWQPDIRDSFPWLRRSGSCRKVVSWSQPLSMELVRKVKRMTNCSTTNEVLISICAGCLTHYFKYIGVEVPGNLAATMPVYFKPFTQADEFGTDGFLTISLPTGDTDNICRLATTKHRMQCNRQKPAKFLLSVFLLRYARLFLPDWILAIALKYLSRNYPLTLTNISLPANSQFSSCGRPLKSMYYWRPPQANTALSLSLITYNNTVSLVAMSAQDIVPQTQIITEHFAKEFNSLACALGIRLEKQSQHHQVETSSQHQQLSVESSQSVPDALLSNSPDRTVKDE